MLRRAPLRGGVDAPDGSEAVPSALGMAQDGGGDLEREGGFSRRRGAKRQFGRARRRLLGRGGLAAGGRSIRMDLLRGVAGTVGVDAAAGRAQGVYRGGRDLGGGLRFGAWGDSDREYGGVPRADRGGEPPGDEDALFLPDLVQVDPVVPRYRGEARSRDQGEDGRRRDGYRQRVAGKEEDRRPRRRGRFITGRNIEKAFSRRISLRGKAFFFLVALRSYRRRS